LIDDAIFVSERERLSRERLGLQQALTHDGDSENAFELAETVLAFSKMAVRAFSTGDANRKRRIVRLTGSNPRLTDGKLSVEAAKPFRLIAEMPTVLERCGFRNDVRTVEAQDGLKPWLDAWRDEELETAGRKMREVLEAVMDQSESIELSEVA
jgi:hypothetical protein